MKLAAGPVCWGVDFADAPSNPGWREVLDGIADAGFAGTELGPYGFLPREREPLAARRLELTGGFVFEPLHEPAEAERIVRLATAVARAVRALGGEYLLIIDSVARGATAGCSEDAPRLRAAARDALGETVEAVAAAAGACGVVPLLHPHAGTYVEFADEIAPLRAICGLCVDTAHLVYAGLDPVDLVASAGCIHLKDLDRSLLGRDFWESVRNGAFVPLGRGCVDFGALLTAAEHYAGWWVVEQDRAVGTGDPVADLRESRRFLEGIA